MTGQNGESAGNKVVISGIAGRFPNSNNITELQNNLLNQVDCTTTEHKRWAIDDPRIPNRLGVCNGIEKFDRIFFGVHTALTDIMDPVSRMLLEHSFEAIMDAGINPRSLRGEKIAVYSATNLSESEKRAYDPKAKKSGFGIMGGSKAMIANRISFFLGLTGPSINIDCDTTSAAVAIERAYTGIKNGEFNGAIVAGGVMALHPHVSFQLRAIGRLSPDGLTRSFDDDADGHTRSDGIAVIFLQRAQDAKRVYIEVVNVRAEHVAPYCSATMTDIIPTRAPQVHLMKKMLKESGLSPDDMSFLEASGMGFRDVDAEELEAIAEAYNKRKKPLLVGAIQSNLGNTIPVNSAAGIIKMIIASETGQIPPNLNYETPNAKAKCLDDGKIEILTEMTPWTGEYSSVHTISMTGTVSNIILKAPNIEKKNDGIPEDDLPRLVVVSGRTEEAVDTLLSYMENRPVDAELLQMFYDVFESGIDGHLYRGYTVVPAKGLPPPDAKKRETFFNSGEMREVWWVFAGMGSQWVGMGEALLRLPVFEAAIRRCDAVLKPRGYDIYKIICDKDEKMFDNIVHSFIGIAAIQVALVDVLRSLGMKPDFIIGHSVGELGCAYADDCFTAEQMVLAALSRGLASKESDLIHGAMAAVGLGYEDVKPLCPPDIDVACHNGPDSSTISGPAESLRAFVASLTAKKIFAKEVASSNIAYHSRYIAPAGPKLLQYLQEVIPKPKPRSEKWLSTSVPRSEWNTLKARLCSAEYHTNNLLSSVLFEETSRMIPQNAICIEIAPHGLLQAILKKSLSPNCINVPLTKRGHPDNVEFMLTGLGKLYNIGLNPKISNLYPRVQYPVGKGTPSISSLVKWDHNADWYVTYFVPIEKKMEGEITYEMNLNAAENEYLKGCKIDGEISVPVSLCLIKAWDILKTYAEKPVEDVVFEDIHIYRLRVPVPDNNTVKLTITVTKGTGKFEIVESDTVVATGTVKSIEAANVERLDASKSSTQQNVKYEMNKEDFYEEMAMRGFQYSGNFKNVMKSTVTGNNGLLKWDDNWVTFIDSAIQLYAFGNDVRQVQVPFMIRKIIIDHKKHEDALQNSGVTAFIDKNLNCITAGGLEVQGLRLAVLPKISEQNRLSTDILAVVPNIDRSNTSISESLRTILQLVLENSFSNNMEVIQFIEKNGSEASKAYKSSLQSVPEICLFKREATSCDKATFNKALTILVEELKEYDVNHIFQKLGSNKFLLTNVKNEHEDTIIKLADSLNTKVILIRKFINNSNLVLFRKKRLLTNTQVVNVNGNIKDTINKVKAIGVPSGDERIVLVTKAKDNLNIVDLVKQLEQSTRLDKIRIFDIQDAKATDNLFADQVYKKQLEMDLLINVYTQKKIWGTVRRTAASRNVQLSKTWTANQIRSHDAENLNWTEGPCMEQTENLIKVEYSSFNSQDILLANRTFFSETSEVSGEKRILPATFGFEYSGMDAKGKRVMGVTCGNAMSTYVKPNSTWTWAVPQSWSFEDAATVPLSYIIAYSTLIGKAEIEEGQKVLLHNISDGPGLAMLNIALHKKCEVYVTYQTEQERKLLKLTSNLPDSHLIDSSKESFTDDVLFKTGGVNVAICNQCGAKKAELLFSACSRKARVVLVSDMNDNKLHESIGMEIFLRELNFFSVVPKQILVSDSSTKAALSKMLADGMKNGCVKPLARNIYNNQDINEAFHACLSKSKLGKIVVKVSAGKDENNQMMVLQRLYCASSKTYVIFEGLNTFGFELIDWLVTRGAQRIVLVSQSVIDNGYTNLRLSLWKKYGVQVILRTKVDISQPQNIKAVLKEASALGPIDAIFDLQRMISTPGKSSANDLTTKTIDQELRALSPNLRLFAVCSAVTNAGALPSKMKMSKFYSIDEIQERLVKELLEKRRKDGLHSVLIKWGLKEDNKVSTSSLPSINKYLQKLDEVLTTKETVVEVSYNVSVTDEVEEDSVEMQINQLDSQKIEKDAFVAKLHAPILENIFILDI